MATTLTTRARVRESEGLEGNPVRRIYTVQPFLTRFEPVLLTT